MKIALKGSVELMLKAPNNEILCLKNLIYRLVQAHL